MSGDELEQLGAPSLSERAGKVSVLGLCKE